MNQLLRKMLALPEQASSMALELDLLHYVVIITSLLGALAVTLAVVYFLIRYRERPGVRAEAKHIPVWTESVAVAVLLALFCGFWVVGFRQFVRLYSPPDDSVEVYVVGKQWMWSFAHADGSASNHDLVVPVGQPVRLLITSRDVIHSFYVPAFRIKKDAVPGQITEAWFEAVRPGAYDILCAEYCGLSHSRMRGRVVALAPQEYESWQRRQETPAADLSAMGERVAAERGCLRCHTLDGTPHLGPSFAGLYLAEIPLVDGRVVVADEAFLTQSMMDPLVMVHRGYAPIMPSYFGVLDAAESAALVELIRSLRDRPRLGPAAPPPAPTTPGEPVDLEKAWREQAVPR